MAESMVWARAETSIVLPHLGIELHTGDVGEVPRVWADDVRAVLATPDEIRTAKAKLAAEKAQKA